MLKEVRKKQRVGQHLVQLWIDEDKYQQIKKAADSVQEPVTNWIRRATFASLRRWAIPEAKVLYEPCSICGKKHDKREHGID